MGYIDFIHIGGERQDIQDYRGERLALTDGYYEGMTVGDAEQLVATVGVQDKVPYLFRTSGGSADIGDREVDKVVGGSFPWNQLISGSRILESRTIGGAVTFTRDADNGTITLNGTATEDSSAGEWTLITDLPVSHHFLYTYIKENGTLGWKISASGATEPRQGKIAIVSGNTYDITYKPQLIDLTQLFGSTIADYIYSLESSTPGAGVAWFRKLFPKPYHAYNAGSMESVCANLHKMTGFNQWDEQWELGAYDPDTGAKVENNNAYRSKNFIPVVPGATYYFYGNITTSGSQARIFWYDADKNYLSMSQKWNDTVTSPENAYFCTFRISGTHTDTTKLCINLHWDGERDGEYEPYVAHSYDLDPVVLRGIPKLDSGNKLYFDGDTYEADGTVTRRYAEITSFSRGALDTTGKLYKISTVTDFAYTGTETRAVCNLFPVDYLSQCRTNADNGIKSVTIYSNNIYIGGFVGHENDLDSILQSLVIVYEKDTPTTESANPYQTPQVVDDWGTEEYVDALATAQTSPRDVAIPVGHDTTYRNNLRAKLEMAPESPSGDGDYIVRQTSGQNEYVALEKELPTLPTEDGTYTLKCTVSGSTKTLTWESDAE